jgi:unsaturated rhamnogalacturonyl hydrolase
MKRRDFLINVPVAGLSLGMTGSLAAGCTGTPGKDSFKNKSITEKVKAALFTMQRRTWEQGVAMQAMLETGEEELVILMARDAVIYQLPDGRLAMVGEDSARTKYGIIYHFTNIPQVWSDSNYMLPPFLAAAGEYNEALKQIRGVRSFLWNKDKKLLSHMWDCEKKVFARKDFWGVGNGWTAAGITRVIRALPASMVKEKSYLVQYVQDIIDGCLAYIREDGLFHNVLDNPQSFVETNLSQMLAYSIYRGIKGGWIGEGYKEKADKMRAATHAKVDELGLVQGVCGAPEFDHAGTAAEGQVFFLLMEVAHKELTG